LLDKLAEEIDRCNSMFYFDYLCNFEQLYALEMNMAMANKSLYYWSDMKQYDHAVSLLDKETLAVFLIPGIVQSSYMWTYVKKAIESEAKVVLLVQTRMNQTIPKEADLIIQFAGRETQIDTIYTNILWKMIAVLFRKRYLRK